MGRFTCRDTEGAVREAGLSLEIVSTVLDNQGVLDYGDWPSPRDSDIQLCYTEEIEDVNDRTGLTDGRNIWVSRNSLDTLVHEWLHVLIYRGCVYERCDHDAAHERMEIWHTAQDAALETWRARP